MMRREGSVAGRLREVGEERSNIVYKVGGQTGCWGRKAGA